MNKTNQGKHLGVIGDAGKPDTLRLRTRVPIAPGLPVDGDEREIADKTRKDALSILKPDAALDASVARRLDDLDAMVVPLGTEFSFVFNTADFRTAVASIGLENAASLGRIALLIVEEKTGTMYELSLSPQKAFAWQKLLGDGLKSINAKALDDVLREATKDTAAAQRSVGGADDNPKMPYAGDKPFRALKKLVPQLPL
jgi:hypothetical protein